jgi:choline-sulfatase
MQAIREAGYSTSVFGKTHLHPHTGDLRDREHLVRAYGLDVVDEIGGPRASQKIMSHMTERWQTLGLLDRYREDFDDRFSSRPWKARASVLPLEEYADTYVGRRAADYLAAYDGRAPWFCWVSFGGPHEPWDAPEPYAGMYDPRTMPEPVVPEEVGPRKGRLHERLAEPAHHPEFRPGEVAAMRANYAGNVTLIDDQIGRILETIRARGEWDDTVVLLSSDHGEMNGDWGLIYKETFLDAAARVPLILRLPGSAPATIDDPVELIDVGPTLAEAAGAELDYRQFGRSLLPALGGGRWRPRSEALSELRGEYMIAGSRYKGAVNTSGELYMLFDRREDPLERINLAGRPGTETLESEIRHRILERIAGSHVNEPDR